MNYSNDELLEWAHDFFGSDCAPTIEDRDGEQWICVADTTKAKRYAILVTAELIQDGAPSRVLSVSVH